MADIAGLVAGLCICPDVVTPQADRQTLNLVISQLVGIPAAERRTGNSLLRITLNEMGIQTFLGDLTTLTEDDIMNLEVRPTRSMPRPPAVPIVWKRKSVIAIAAYHHCARLKGASIDMCLFPVELYDHFCISLYRHKEKIIPCK